MKVFMVIVLFTMSVSAIELHWLNDYQKAIKIAKNENKGVYVFIGADRCRFCDILKKEALSKPNVLKRLTKKFVPVYLSRDKDKVPQQFSIKGVPRHYFLTKDEKLIHQDQGSREESGFLLMLDEVDLETD